MKRTYINAFVVLVILCAIAGALWQYRSSQQDDRYIERIQQEIAEMEDDIEFYKSEIPLIEDEIRFYEEQIRELEKE